MEVKQTMKKILSLLLALSMLFALAACGGKTDPAETDKPEQTESPAQTETPAETEKPEETEPPEGTEKPEETEQPEETPEQTETPAPTQTPVQPTPAPTPAPTPDPTPAPTETPSTSGGALDILNAAWSGMSDDDKFPAVGGDFSEANMVSDAPGKYALTDSAEADRALGLPTDWFDKVDDAASLIHMMNTNTFTCGAFHAASADDAASLAVALKTNILARHWMCGMPDKVVILTAGEYVISIFGHTDLVDAFAAQLVANAGATIVSDDPAV